MNITKILFDYYNSVNREEVSPHSVVTDPILTNFNSTRSFTRQTIILHTAKSIFAKALSYGIDHTQIFPCDCEQGIDHTQIFHIVNFLWDIKLSNSQCYTFFLEEFPDISVEFIIGELTSYVSNSSEIAIGFFVLEFNNSDDKTPSVIDPNFNISYVCVPSSSNNRIRGPNRYTTKHGEFTFERRHSDRVYRNLGANFNSVKCNEWFEGIIKYVLLKNVKSDFK